MHAEEGRAASTTRCVLDVAGLQALVGALRTRGYAVMGPTVRNGAIVHAEISSVDDLPRGRRCEQAIRNYDPCISCATHFLDLTVERR